MISYKELGLVNTRKMFAKAVDGGYAIPAFNFNNMEQMQQLRQPDPAALHGPRCRGIRQGTRLRPS